jgi:succinylarginine dihydrolase
VEQVVYVDVNDSMRNGGGPACLRFRVQLTQAERAAVLPRVFFDDTLDKALGAWIERHYRDRLTVDDLRDPALLQETRRALDELTGLLELGSIYDFQRA